MAKETEIIYEVLKPRTFVNGGRTVQESCLANEPIPWPIFIPRFVGVIQNGIKFVIEASTIEEAFSKFDDTAKKVRDEISRSQFREKLAGLPIPRNNGR